MLSVSPDDTNHLALPGMPKGRTSMSAAALSLPVVDEGEEAAAADSLATEKPASSATLAVKIADDEDDLPTAPDL